MRNTAWRRVGPPAFTRRLPAVWLLLLLAVAVARAADLPPEIAAKVDEKVEAFREQNHVPGVSVAIVVRGQLARESGHGLADVENAVPASADTVYRLASISKMLSAVAALQLVEQARLDLQAPIQKYVADFPVKQAPITCELLLKHQSGIRHYKDGEASRLEVFPTLRDALSLFKDDPLLFSPGEKFSYTTYGFNLLGVAIEAASGQPFADYVQQHVCQPAGMKSIQPDDPRQIIPHRAAGYRWQKDGKGEGGQLFNDTHVDVRYKLPGGGWCSTAGDLARFAIALMDGKLITSQSLERMWTVQKTANGTATNSGLGCFVDEAGGYRRISHSGGQPKVSTFLILAPERRAAVAVMCNLSDAKPKDLAGDLLTLVVE